MFNYQVFIKGILIKQGLFYSLFFFFFTILIVLNAFKLKMVDGNLCTAAGYEHVAVLGKILILHNLRIGRWFRASQVLFYNYRMQCAIYGRATAADGCCLCSTSKCFAIDYLMSNRLWYSVHSGV